MSEITSSNTVDPLHAVWSMLRNHGFEAAERHAATLSSHGETPQLHADLCASAEQFEAAYHSASLAPADGQAGERYGRLALFADALERPAAAQRYSELAVAAQPSNTTRDWIVRLFERYGAYSAGAHMLRAYEQREPLDARAPWWLALVLEQLPGEAVKAERRAALRRAYVLEPAIHAGMPLQLVLAHREIRDWDTVEQICRDRLAADPADAEMAWQLSHAQWQRNDAAGAEATMRAVDAAAPGQPPVAAAIGFYLGEQARYGESEVALHAALALDQSAATPAVDLADLELRRGAWTLAWPRFEARLRRDDREANNVVTLMANIAPPWQREPLGGKTLLVHSEQGNGDDIQMVRFVPELAARVRDEGGRLVLAVRAPLQPFFARFHADCCAIETAIETAIEAGLGAGAQAGVGAGIGAGIHAVIGCKPDFILPMMSMPYMLGVQPDQVRGVAYLQAGEDKVAAWRSRVSPSAGNPALPLQIGLVWSGSPTHRRDAKRSIPLAALAPVLALPDIEFHPLTPGRRADVAALSAQGYRIRDLTAHYEHGFDDAAAHVTVLDAVLTIDSAPLHLGGALGRPVLAMLDHVSHWSWGDQEVQPWYDSVELFRQPRPGAWEPVVERVIARLRALVAARRRAG